MDREAITFWNQCAQGVRDFFVQRQYLEVHTPCLSSTLIPESSIEVFRTERNTHGKTFFLLPSPELQIKRLLAQHKCSVFELAHAFRSTDSATHIHNHEFTMLEYYTVGATYTDSITITEKLFSHLAETLKTSPLFNPVGDDAFTKPFMQLTMDEAFERFAGFPLSAQKTKEALLQKVMSLNIADESLIHSYTFQELYELVLVSVIEPALPKNRIVALLDYPAVSNTLSVQKWVNSMPVTERWECYLNGVELANCYTEQTNPQMVETFFKEETEKRKKNGMLPIQAPSDFAKICSQMPPCSGVALGFERLLMLLAGKKTIDPFLIRS